MKKTSGAATIAAAVLASLFFVSVSSCAAPEEARPAAAYTEHEERKTVIPCGTPFGVKMLTDGVVVTDFGAVNGRFSQQSPAEAAGLHKGDIVKSVNGVEITDSISVAAAVQLDPECTIEVLREGKEMSFSAQALISDIDGEYKLGMWTKDSAAGIGTMTYYDPETGTFAGLGHAVSEQSSGVKMPLLSGEITAVTITDVIKGSGGIPGELCGAFISSVELGRLTGNSEFGIFGTCENSPILTDPVEIARRGEVRAGKAVIYATTSGMMPEEYEIEIISLDRGSTSPVKNMTIRITDRKLLDKTGGIVQGMSGSPILQNGRLVGAVTHVLVSDPSMGYAVFAENMHNAYLSGAHLD